ncbi:MAG: pirin family protein [Desulfovibrio sp.]|jgi:redox-sensitive bicupin YhaK (pirin superfamily)|nr:pirin family protein [Desulfovibrio sp.]
MLRYIDSKKMGRGIHGWLDSHFHFSFADYRNPENINFGVLRVLNDDLVQPDTGFGTHPHRNMEILSYVVEGELTHADSMQNRETLTRGQVQYMSAGTGVHHSEYNLGDSALRFLQIWILPDRDGYLPSYGSHRFELHERDNRWMPVAARYGNPQSEAPISVHADVNVYASLLDKGRTLDFEVNKGRQAYFVLIEGQSEINGVALNMRDALEIVEENIAVKAGENSHMLVIEMAKS